jgi:hypothetical protein
MVIGRLKIKKLNVVFVFRHRWESTEDPFMFKCWELGFWFKPSRMLGVKGFTKPKHHLVNMYMLGINLLVCKAWVEWDINGLHFGEDLKIM